MYQMKSSLHGGVVNVKQQYSMVIIASCVVKKPRQWALQWWLGSRCHWQVAYSCAS